MAKRKKQQGTPAASASTSLGGRRPAFLMMGAVVAALAAVLVVAVVVAGGGDNPPEDDGLKTAVIVDQLQLTQPNPDFVSEARGVLAGAGYSVDYIPGENVTVDFYRTLPDKNYDLVLMRVHAGITTEIDQATGEKTGTEYVSLFTGEPYDESKYSSEQLGRLGKARYTADSDPLFGIGPEFVKESMDGDFNGATIVMMGCDGLRSQVTAEAFLDRGASSFVSWSQQVSAPHTDTATVTLLQHLLVDQQPIAQAVETTAAEVGPDPSYDAELRLLTG